METKWTPGPWSLSPEPDDCGDAVLVKTAQWDIATVWDGMLSSRANAHLIAAAPDLYAALAEVSGFAHQTARDRDLSESELAFMRRVDAALAKARGEA